MHGRPRECGQACGRHDLVPEEPLRRVCSWFMVAGTASVSPTSHPPLLDMLRISSSILTQAMQYYGTLLDFKSDRLRLLWQYCRGLGSVEAWARERPADVWRFRGLVMLAMTWAERRFAKMLSDLDLYGLADSRRVGRLVWCRSCVLIWR